ncbi:MAG: hypothetical protein M1818_005718 [Claussenomyces sp. TS43310]|nr:MAG: hypothetical protein M1818_005718 [Claussenomyces sp. TS43310]
MQLPDSLRLIDQHDWLKGLLGCTVHPAIPTNTPGLRVADVATGTAIFLLDLAKTLPADAQLYGFDISTAQFPAPEARPSNVFLHEHSVTNPFPEDYHGYFDIVAVRLITAGLRGDDWDAAVKNLNVLLKPGGYLQWIEPVHSSLQIFNSKVGAPNSAAREAVQYFLEAYKMTLYPGPLQLPALCLKYKLDDIVMEVFATDHFPDFEKVRSQGKLFLSGACTAMFPFLVKDESSALTAEHADEVVKRAMEEMEGEIYLHSEMQFVVRRKSSLPI